MIINCPKCSKTFKQEIKFLEHLGNEHNIVDVLNLYLELYYKSVHPTCACSESCTALLKWNGWNKGFQSKFVRGHNAKLSSPFTDTKVQKDILAKRIESFQNGSLVIWNKGLTKESDERILSSSDKISNTLKQRYESDLVSWQTNKTKENSESLQKMSDTKKKKFSSGELKIWNLGLTKQSHVSIDSASKKISEAYAKREMGKRLSESCLNERLSKFSDKFELISATADYKVRRVARLHFRCVKCGFEQAKSLAMLEESPVCFNCSPRESKGQLELYDFVKSLSKDAILSDRTVIAPKELDVWVPSRKLGIEYNGLYWHSVKVISDEQYHVKKASICDKNDIKLFSIFEDDWHNNRSLIESMIKHRLGLDTFNLNARSLKLSKLTNKEAKVFFDTNHLDGYVASLHTFCLKTLDGLIVAALSLRRPFHRKYDNRFEVARCAVLKDYNVRGWLGKLSKAALEYAKNNNKIGLMTYVDGRVGKGIGYVSAGWQKQASSEQPRFWWTDFQKRYNRFKFRANKEKTEEQVALESGVVKIFGCSNSLYFLT